ncbi:MAG: hypothetical protein DMD26_11550 [Gemmatimonadetes bacterium]|nr:MAG: hypothetical protein DMD26_11550 [Gemmatimonadota bacterium]
MLKPWSAITAVPSNGRPQLRLRGLPDSALFRRTSAWPFWMRKLGPVSFSTLQHEQRLEQ